MIMRMPETVVFRAEDGQELVYLSEHPRDGQVLYSPDGRLHYELYVGTLQGSNSRHTLWFQDPHHLIRARIERDGDRLRLSRSAADGSDVVTSFSRVALRTVPLPGRQEQTRIDWTPFGQQYLTGELRAELEEAIAGMTWQDAEAPAPMLQWRSLRSWASRQPGLTLQRAAYDGQVTYHGDVPIAVWLYGVEYRDERGDLVRAYVLDTANRVRRVRTDVWSPAPVDRVVTQVSG